ncbi:MULTISPECIES: DUF3046 domain-containing protein [Arthrobacter]|uniref:DUF3046 domain-containing protein n=2 Tax=Arthrobacter TaxID=1663 RepID=A0ABU9KM74_9MICC|nr:DUF3046 domain-containing protein [Arthrobacter sp. YJM1]MDP5227855.1 DUF3046 domain-containing protein [Arthrobacter sp. YJM1]
MRRSQFWQLMDDEFGAAYSRHLAGSLALRELGSRTPLQAISDGWDLKAVWIAVCEAQDVPEQRRLGKEPKPVRGR